MAESVRWRTSPWLSLFAVAVLVSTIHGVVSAAAAAGDSPQRADAASSTPDTIGTAAVVAARSAELIGRARRPLRSSRPTPCARSGPPKRRCCSARGPVKPRRRIKSRRFRSRSSTRFSEYGLQRARGHAARWCRTLPTRRAALVLPRDLHTGSSRTTEAPDETQTTLLGALQERALGRRALHVACRPPRQPPTACDGVELCDQLALVDVPAAGAEAKRAAEVPDAHEVASRDAPAHLIESTLASQFAPSNGLVRQCASGTSRQRTLTSHASGCERGR